MAWKRSFQATSWVHYTTSCNTQSSDPEDGRDQRPKHVEVIGIINKPLLLHLGGVYIIQVSIVNHIKETFSLVMKNCCLRYFCGLLYETATKTDYIVINGRMTGEQLINEELERGVIDVMERIYRHLFGCIVEYHGHLRYYIQCTGPVSKQVYPGYFLNLLRCCLACCDGVVEQLISFRDICRS